MTEDRAGRPDSFQLPCFGQTADSIERWVKAEASPGSIVVVRHTRWHLYEYHLDEVAKLNLRAGRIYLAQHGRFSLNILWRDSTQQVFFSHRLLTTTFF